MMPYVEKLSGTALWPALEVCVQSSSVAKFCLAMVTLNYGDGYDQEEEQVATRQQANHAHYLYKLL
jgi:hypothetical protein